MRRPPSRLQELLSHALLRPLLLQPGWVAVAVVALLLSVGQPVLQRLELDLLDSLGRIVASLERGPEHSSEQVIVAIDEPSLSALGRWPWPRDLHAQLLDRLAAAGVRGVGYAVMFSEASIEPGGASHDLALAEALRRQARVVLPVAPSEQGPGRGLGAQLPWQGFAAAAAAIGHVDAEIDSDGLVRRLYLDGQAGDRQWEALPAALWRLTDPQVAQVALGPSPAALKHPVNTGSWQRDRERLMPMRQVEIPRVSALQVLHDPAVAATLAGRIVWVGVTAHGLSNPILTPAAPRGTAWSSVEWQAQLMHALMQRQLVSAAGSMGVTLVNLLPTLLLASVMHLHRGRLRRWRLLLPLVPLPLLASLGWLLAAREWVPTLALTTGLLVTYLIGRTAELQEARSELDRAQGLADATLRAITDAVLTLDARLRLCYLNTSAEKLVGHGAEAVRGRPVTQLLQLSPRDAQVLETALDECLSQRRVVLVQQPLRVHDGEAGHLVRLIANPVRGGPGEPNAPSRGRLPGSPAVVLALSDITAEVLANEQLHHETTHDSLTGLPNRLLLTDRLQHALTGLTHSPRGLAVLFVDLDRFKRINDSLGHRKADVVLQEVARRLVACCRAHDTVARWGGDEFVVLLEDVLSREAVAAQAARLIEQVAAPYSLDGMEVECACCVGIALAPQDGHDAEGLIALADTAMYRGKEQGGRRFEFYASEMPAWTREWLALEARLRHGLEENSFVLHYQPQVDLVSGRPVGLEALLRWRQPDGELWSPARFLNVTEETGLILSIGAWVIRESVQQQARWREAGVPLVPVSVNVSARQCLDAHLLQVVRDALAASDIPAQLLKIEVTESTAMADLGQLNSLLTELRAMGVAVSMDDFGTGYSSLAHLKRFPFDQIKIDPSFVNDITLDRNGAAIVRATIALAHGLGVPVVAEGVENEEQRRFLANHHCDIAQGYLYAHPLASEDAAQFLRERSGLGLPAPASAAAAAFDPVHAT